jgi:NitT/TauT family transport system ATP-binding protein
MGTRVSRIRFENVSKVFPRGNGAFAALEDVSFEVEDQEFVTIVGPSGCGKTTLMRMVAGLERPTVGSVLVGDRPVRGPGPDRAVVFQQFALFPWKTVGQNIAFGLKSKGVSRRKQVELVADYLKLMKLEGTEDSYPYQLSGGMQQRVAIARSYAIEPEVLLMDEPFGALDAQTRTIMQEELIRITAANPRTVLFITHSVEDRGVESPSGPSVRDHRRKRRAGTGRVVSARHRGRDGDTGLRASPRTGVEVAPRTDGRSERVAKIPGRKR